MISNQSNSAVRLHEIDFMRPMVIVLLIMMHSFTLYSEGGSWGYPEGIGSVTAYKWITIITYGCMLEAFTFISGYLFGFQMKKNMMDLWPLIVSKLKRLILPSILFGILYISIIDDFNGRGNVMQAISVMLSGAGHLWYLPMLFWCFIIAWLIRKIKINERIKLIGLFLLSIIAVVPIPLKLNTVFHYFPFFYLGMYVFDNPPPKITSFNVALWLAIFLLVLTCVMLYRDAHASLANWQKMLLWYAKQLYAFCGTYGMFLLCKLLGRKFKVSDGLLSFNKCCFGIYIFQQFVLRILYYQTSLPSLCGTYLLPWCGLITAFIISLGLTTILRKTKVGAYLLG